MKYLFSILTLIMLITITGCVENKEETTKTKKEDNFQYQTEQFADIGILRYKVPGFDTLSLKQKRLLYYLSQAALSGRDIIYDQNNKYNLRIRRTLEAVVDSYDGNRDTDEFKDFMVYTKRVWFSNGIHHHYSTDKIMPDFSKEYFTELVKNSDKSELPLSEDKTVDELLATITPVMFDPDVAEKRVNLNPDEDIIVTSANNYYEGVTQKEVEDFYNSKIDESDTTPIWYGLNSKVVKEDGEIKEEVYKVGGLYSPAIEKIVYWLEKAIPVAETEVQKKTLEKLVDYYKTGDLETWDEYNILWVQDTAATVDAVNGFIEVYGDPLGYKGAYESVVSFKDLEATKRINAISKNAQWFEDNSPIMDEHKKENVVGISAKVITVVMESGDASPSTPIGINLPNSTWIRKQHGSKSVNLGNIVHAYDKAAAEGSINEFAYDDAEIERAKKYGSLGDNLHTDMHEVIGHASGQINPGVGTPKQTLKNYASTIEEARADLVALYYLMDQKLIDIGVMPNFEAGKAAYDAYIRNGLMQQLRRIEPGNDIEESHMRNRQLIAKWVYEKGKDDNVIEKKVKNGKTYFVINDYQKLRTLFGDLLREIQRITSEGDYKSAKELVENYGVKVDPELHKEVLSRYEKLNIAPYKGFINPKLVTVMEGDEIVDVKIEYPDDFTKQMMNYAENYSFLPNKN